MVGNHTEAPQKANKTTNMHHLHEFVGLSLVQETNWSETRMNRICAFHIPGKNDKNVATKVSTYMITPQLQISHCWSYFPANTSHQIKGWPATGLHLEYQRINGDNQR